jgi:serine/threonine protein kinase
MKRNNTSILDHLYQIAQTGKFYVPYEELDIKKEVMAHGQFSEVHECLWRGLNIVIKKPLNYTIQNIHDFLVEVEVWSSLRHPYIAQFLGFSIYQNDVIILMEKINR